MGDEWPVFQQEKFDIEIEPSVLWTGAIIFTIERHLWPIVQTRLNDLKKISDTMEVITEKNRYSPKVKTVTIFL